MSDGIMLDFEHLPGGKNCMTSSLWKLLHHLGHDVSEEMLVGIGSGLGFIYWKMKQMATPFVGGMNGGRFPTILGLAVDRLGGEWNVLKSSSIKRAHGHLRETLDMNQPALICADLGFLDYLSLGGDDHFGMHTILVYGIDEGKDEAYISDRFATTITIPLSRLQKARASEYHPFPAKNKMMQVSMPEETVPLDEIIPFAIRENMDFMLNPPISNMGAGGILRWKKELKRYPKILPDNRTIMQALIEHFVYIEVGGSGGALFRRMYSQFLKEASKVMKDPELRKASLLYNDICADWSELAIRLTPDEMSSLARIREIYYQNNHDMEQNGVNALDDVKERLSDVPSLMKAATNEVEQFDSIVTDTADLLDELHRKETQVAERLAAWAKI
ncbi:MAG: BtrH N-terminal domain-containing protein [Candidatus Thorarchaeota archaeon]